MSCTAEGGTLRSNLSPLALRAGAAAGFRSPAAKNDPPDRFLYAASSPSERKTIKRATEKVALFMVPKVGLEPVSSGMCT